MAVDDHHRKAGAARDPWNVFGGGTPAVARSVSPAGSPASSGSPEPWEPSRKKPIGEILVGAGVISGETRDSVLEYQEWNHVSFGTALLEAGQLPENLLLRALAVQSSVPGASAADLESIPSDILALVKRRIVERLSVIPFRKVGRTLHVAMARPSDEPAIRSIALLTGLTVVPHVAIAVRLALAIEKHYGIPAAAHLKAVAGALGDAPDPAAPQARTAPVLADAIPPGIQAPPLDDVRAVEPMAERPRALPPWHDLTEGLCEARNPDQLAVVLLGFLRESIGPAALYRVRRNDAVLWKAWPASTLPPSLSIPLSASSLLASLRNTADVFAGPCPDTRENRQILASVDGRLPESVIVIPVNLNDRTVLFVVAHPGGNELPLDTSSLERLARITATALGLVALHRRLLSL